MSKLCIDLKCNVSYKFITTAFIIVIINTVLKRLTTKNLEDTIKLYVRMIFSDRKDLFDNLYSMSWWSGHRSGNDPVLCIDGRNVA